MAEGKPADPSKQIPSDFSVIPEGVDPAKVAALDSDHPVALDPMRAVGAKEFSKGGSAKHDDDNDGPEATPAAEAHAEETGVDLNKVKGTGSDGTITKGDVAAAAERR